MKKTIIFIAGLAIAAMSCTKEANNDVKEPVAKKIITVNTSIDTRTVLSDDHNSLLWTEGDNFRLFTDAEGYDPQTLTYSQGGSFEAEVSETATKAYAYYFAGTYNQNAPTSYSTYINSVQTQSQAGVLNGQLLPMVAKGTINANNTVSLDFHQLAGVLALNIYNADKVEGETIQSVLVTPTANTKFAGQSILDITQDDVIYTEGAEKYTTVKVELTTPYNFPTTKPESKKMGDGQIYVVLAKQNYTTLDFTITTSAGVYTITGTNFDLTANDFLPVNINLAKATFVEPFAPEKYTWTLVTDAISIGDKVVIAANASDKALSITQQSNNRKATNVSKSGNVLTATSDVQAFEVVAGTADGSFAFKSLNGDTAGQYIYAASSSSNQLKSEETLDANGSWSVSIASTGAATVTAQGANTRKVLQFNSGSDIFACYASASQAAIAIYKQGEAADPEAKAIFSNGTIEVAATGASANYEGAYTLKNIDETQETVNLTASENIVDPSALDGVVAFSMAPNYTSSKVTGQIVLTLASDETVTATIPVEQKSSSLKVSATEVVIPANASEITFTVTSPDFGWTIVADDDTNIAFDDSGEASATASTVTVMSNVEAGEEIQTIATLTVSRTENDPQAKQVVIKKAASSEEIALYSATFEGDGEHRANTSNSYNTNTYTVSGVEWTLGFGDSVISGTPLDGSANLLFRIAKNTTNSPSATTANLLSTSKTITKITFLSKLGSNVTLTVQYSTDGTTWNTVTATKDTDVHATYGYSATIPDVETSDFRLKYTWSVASSTTSNRDSQLDDVIVYGK